MTSEWNKTVRILAVLAFAVWVIHTDQSWLWVVLAALVAGL
jgi:hypothetical protein